MKIFIYNKSSTEKIKKFNKAILGLLISSIILSHSVSIDAYAKNSLGKEQSGFEDTNNSNTSDTTYEYLRDENATVTDSEYISGPTRECVPDKSVNDRIHYIRLTGGRGSSDAIVIESNGHYGLIDASYRYGDRSIDSVDPLTSGKEVQRYLSALGVDHLDFVLATHAHNDHMGGIPDVVQAVAGMNILDTKQSTFDIQETYQDSTGNVIEDQCIKDAIDAVTPERNLVTSSEEVENVYLVNSDTTYIYKSLTYNYYEESKMWGNSIVYNEAEKAMENANKLLVDQHSDGMELLGAEFHQNGSDTLDDTISFKFGDYNITLYNLYSVSTDSENANSIITLVEKDGVKTVLTGDINVNDKLEQKLAQIITEQNGTIDVLKIPHHGFEKSTSKELIDTFDADYAVLTTSLFYMSVYSPFYGYLKEKGIKQYRTMDIAENAIVQDLTDGLNFTKAQIVEGVQNKLVSTYYSEYIIERSYDSVYGVSGAEETAEIINAVKSVTETETVTRVENVYQTNDLIYDGEPTEWVIDEKAHWTKWYTDWDKYDNVYVKEDGSLLKGWNTIGNYTYYFDQNGIQKTGWVKRDGYDVYLKQSGSDGGTKGSLSVGWTSIDGSWYYFDTKGHKYSGLLNSEGKKYYFNNGKMVTDTIIDIKGVNHYFNKDGQLSGGFHKVNRKLYYFHSNGTASKGWITLNNKKYYTSSSGIVEIGWKEIDGGHYYFNSNGEMLTDWQQIDGDMYYFDKSGKRVTGWKIIEGHNYLFDDSGKKRTGWISKNNQWSYLGDDGLVYNSWIVDGIAVYYLDEKGVMLSNQWKEHKWLRSNGVCDPACYAEWKCNSLGWWYEDKSGWYPSGQWQKIDGKRYYFTEEGYKATNQWVDGYWLNQEGQIDTRYSAEWKCNSLGWWYEDKSGWYPKNQWQLINEDWYYFSSDGYMVTEEWVDGYWIDLDGHIDEGLSAEWKVNNTGWWFEYDTGWYPKEQWLKIDGVWYHFNKQGYMTEG